MKTNRIAAVPKRLAALGPLLSLACTAGGSSSPPDAGSDAAGPALHGAITVKLQEAIENRPAFGLVSGKVYDGPVPELLPLTLARSEGDCGLWKPEVPFCDPACGSEAACVAGGRCARYPGAVDVGVISVSGLALPVTIDPEAPGFNYQSAELPYPPCAEGAEVTLTARGLSMTSTCPAPLLVPAEVVWRIRRGQSLPLAWTPPRLANSGRLQIHLDIAHHGGQKTGEIICNTADDGAFEVPATLIDALIDLGVAGFPSISLTRARSVAATAHPDLTFNLVSTIQRPVDTGLVSCLENGECPPGATCDPVRVVCVVPE